MGDLSVNQQDLADEEYRLTTYGDQDFTIGKKTLARAGFYFTRVRSDVKCFECDLELDAQNINPATDVARFHKEKKPDCGFAQKLTVNLKRDRSKKFVSYDSLRFEKERLETFIEWPIQWLSPNELAKDGFYYLRTNDHCACVFCRGIVGAWEKGDTPRGEHQRHFPHCPFIRGQPVGNVPIAHSDILASLPDVTPIRQGRQINGPPGTTDSSRKGIDVCGTPRLMDGSFPDSEGGPKDLKKLADLGLPQYTGPKRKDFLTVDIRVKSFSRWPERVEQKPEDLAEAGFFYCGLSDHVRCFHCGNGLRNWETDDDPWREHARWYPDCSFVAMKKGQAFIDQVRRERPPYIRTQTNNNNNKANSQKSQVSPVKSVSDEELKPLMELDIMQAVLGMGFPPNTVRDALRRKIEQTGLPFFSLEPCIEAVLQYMEEETRRILQQGNAREIAEEAAAQQAAKLEAISEDNVTSPSTSGTANASTSTSEASVAPTSTTETSIAPSTSNDVLSTSANSTSVVPSASTTNNVFPPTPSTSSSSTPSPALSPTSPQETPENVPAENVPAPIPSTSNTGASQEPVEQMEIEDSVTNDVQESEAMDIILEADENMVKAEKALKPVQLNPAGQQRLELKIKGEAANKEVVGASPTKIRKSPTPQSSKELEDELERIRESSMCKLCMDAEMDVVFLPCSHMVACTSCAVALTQCPICREQIKYTVKPIRS